MEQLDRVQDNQNDTDDQEDSLEENNKITVNAIDVETKERENTNTRPIR